MTLTTYFNESNPDNIVMLKNAINSGSLGDVPTIMNSCEVVDDASQHGSNEANEERVEHTFVTGGLDCINSTYGCCADGNSPAEGPNGKGCAEGRHVVI